jgi:hypothetical protein
MNQRYLFEDPPALDATARSRADPLGFLRAVATWPEHRLAELAHLLHHPTKAKPRPERCRLAEGGILMPPSGRWRNSGAGGPGEFWTFHTPDDPGTGPAATLWDILKAPEDVPPEYHLKPRQVRRLYERLVKYRKHVPEELAELVAALPPDP